MLAEPRAGTLSGGLLADREHITSVAGDEPHRIAQLMGALGFYGVAVIAGLAIQTLIIYPVLLRLFTRMKFGTFFAGIAPAQLVAFSTSSSGATLPVTITSPVTPAWRPSSPRPRVVGPAGPQRGKGPDSRTGVSGHRSASSGPLPG